METVHLAWGAKVSNALALRVIQTGKDFNFNPDWLMACMAFETGRTFSPSVKNPHSSATGLIQFMAATAQAYKVTTAQLAAMTAEKQFDYVWLYFRDVIKVRGPIKSLADCYMVILNPVAVGKPLAYAMWVSGSSAYTANAGLDTDKDHRITKAEAAARVGALLIEGMGPTNAADIVVGEPAATPVQPAPKPKESIMSLVSSAFHFVFDHAFASAARTAATADPVAAAVGIEVIKNLPMPVDGSANSVAGVASGAIGELENALNEVVSEFVKKTIDQLPVVGALADATGLDQKAADACKAMLVLAEQHALTYVSALFSGHHVAINSVTAASSEVKK